MKVLEAGGLDVLTGNIRQAGRDSRKSRTTDDQTLS